MRGMWLMATLAAGYFYALAHAPIGELGLLVGDPQAEVTGVVTCWSATLGA